MLIHKVAPHYSRLVIEWSIPVIGVLAILGFHHEIMSDSKDILRSMFIVAECRVSSTSTTVSCSKGGEEGNV